MVGGAVETCWVRFALVDDEWRPTTLFQVPLTPDRIRALPLHRVEIAVNANAQVRDTLATRINAPIAETGTPQFIDEFMGYGHHPEAPITLERPSGKLLTDEWYGKVADAYVMAAARGLKPRKTIAEVAGVSLDVAGRWIYEARKRGLLAPTQPGRVRTQARTKEDKDA